LCAARNIFLSGALHGEKKEGIDSQNKLHDGRSVAAEKYTNPAAVYAYTPSDRKTCGLATLVLIILFAVLICSVHFASLTVGRQINSKAMPLLSQQLSFCWGHARIGCFLG
jgi:hypothetical protein